MKWSSSGLKKDASGIIWPISSAPFQAHVIILNPQSEEVVQSASVVYRELKAHGVTALLDDRADAAESKIKEADLLGLPIRIQIGDDGLKNGEVEIIIRQGQKSLRAKLEDAVDKVVELKRELTQV